MYDKIEAPTASICAKIVKGLTFFSAFLISGFGAIGLLFMIYYNIISTTFFLVFSPVFIILFGGIIVAIELRVRWVLESFQFLQSMLGKGLFYIYASSSVFYFFTCGGYQNQAVAWISSLTLFGLGLLFCILHLMTGSYSSEMRAELNPSELV